MTTQFKVLNAGRQLNNEEILTEINRDRSEDWQNYTLDDLLSNPEDTLSWIDEEYYEVVLY